MRGRRTPPIVLAPAHDADPSQDADYRYFFDNPSITEYTRPYIAGETAEPMPPGTLVHVHRIGPAGRARGFVPPSVEAN